MNEAPGLRRKPTTYVNHLLTPPSLIPVSKQLDHDSFFFFTLYSTLPPLRIHYRFKASASQSTQLALPGFGLISTHLHHVFFQVLAARSVKLAEPE